MIAPSFLHRFARYIVLCASVLALTQLAVAGETGSHTMSGSAGIFTAKKSGINHSTGAPVQTFEFQLPPGRITPKLSLNYSIGGGTSHAGEGWGLNLPSIRRVRDTEGPPVGLASQTTPYIKEPFPWPGSMDDSGLIRDHFEIDGEPLIAICQIVNQSCGVSPGERFPTYTNNSVLYRRQHENEYIQYFKYGKNSFGGSEYAWVERTQDGHVRIFGDHQAISQLTGGPQLPSRDLYAYEYDSNAYWTKKRVRWNLAIEFDHNRSASDPTKPTNVIAYQWSYPTEKSFRNNLEQIFYDLTDGPADSWESWAHRVRLQWETPNHPISGYAPGWIEPQLQRLQKIEISSRSGTNPTSSIREVVRRYHLTYHSDRSEISPRSKSYLASVQMEGRCIPTAEPESNMREVIPKASCPLLPPTSFEYTGLTSQTAAVVWKIAQHSTLANEPTIFPGYRKASVFDANRDGWPDVYEKGRVVKKPPTCAKWYDEESFPSLHLSQGYSGGNVRFREELVSNLALGSDSILALDPTHSLTLVDFTSGRGTVDLVYSKFGSHDWCRAHLEQFSSLWSWKVDSCGPARQWNRCVTCQEAHNCDLLQTPSTDFNADGSCVQVSLTGDINGDGIQDVYEDRLNRWNHDNSTQAFPIVHLGGRWHGREQAFEVPVRGQVWMKPTLWSALADMNGDGIADLVSASSTDTDSLGVWFGLGTGEFSCIEPNEPSEDGIPHCRVFGKDICVSSSFSDARCTPGLHLAAAPGSAPLWDGLNEPHISVCYESGNGDSNCDGYTGTADDDRRPARFVHDVNGDGLADIIRVLSYPYNNNPIRLTYSVYLNQDGGHHFKKYCDNGVCDFIIQATQPSLVNDEDNEEESEPCGGPGDPPGGIGGNDGIPDEVFGDASVHFADMNASGVDDIVFVFKDGVYYVDLLSGALDREVAPGLLSEVRNGYGAYTKYEYKTIQQLGVGKNWTTRSSQVAPVVVRQKDGIEGPDFVRREHTTDYQYSNPAYDPWTRRLVGFGMVVEDPAAGPTTIRRYQFGPCQNQDGCWQTSDQDWTTAISNEPYEEILSDGTGVTYPFGKVLSSTVVSFIVREVRGMESRPSWIALPTERRQWVYNPEQGQSEHTQSVVVATGPQIRTEPPPKEERVVSVWSSEYDLYYSKKSYITNAFALLSYDENYGTVNPQSMAPLGQVIVTQVIHGGMLNSGESFHFVPSYSVLYSYNSSGGRETSFVPDGVGNITEIRGHIYGTLGLARSHSGGGAVAPSPSGASTSGEVVLEKRTYDQYGRIKTQAGAPVSTSDGVVSTCTEYVYDPPWVAQPTEVLQRKGGCGGAVVLRTTAINDLGWGVPRTSVTAAGEVSSHDYDPFGRPSALKEPHPTVRGMSSGSASWRIVYPENYDGTVNVVSKTHHYRQTMEGPEHHSVVYKDGAGEEVLTVVEADQAAGDSAPWVVVNQVERDSLGRPDRIWRPWGYSGNELEVPLTAPASTRLEFLYDVLGRHSYTFDEGSTVYRRDYFGARREHIYDAEDLDDDSPHAGTSTEIVYDGFGRRTEFSERLGNQIITTKSSYAITGEVVAREVVSGGVTSQKLLYTYDSLGRMTSSRQARSDAEGRRRYFAYNDAGWLVGTSDERGCGENIRYDSLGRLKTRDFSPCTAEQEPYSGIVTISGRGTIGYEAEYKYDVNGTTSNAPSGGSYAGRIVSVSDRASSLRYDYDARGHQAKLEHQIAPPTTIPRLAYTTPVYEQRTTYNKLNQIVSTTTGAKAAPLLPNGASSITREYSRRGLLTQIASSYSATPLLKNTYELDGQIATSVLGDRAKTEAQFYYDDRRRLEHYTVSRNPPPLWNSSVPGYPAPSVAGGTRPTNLMDTTFHRDEIGNPLIIEDHRDGEAWAPGAKPRTLNIKYDDLYRTTKVATTFADGPDIFVSPHAAEAASGTDRAIPRQIAGARTAEQVIEYSAHGDITKTTDNENLFWDRSLSSVVYDAPAGGGARMVSANNGALKVRYDLAGNITDLVVRRDGTCLPAGCHLRFRYQWDEKGNLEVAKRWDSTVPFPSADLSVVPTTTPAVSIRYHYGERGRVSKDVTADSETLHTVDVFDTLQLKDARFGLNGVNVYEDTAYTEQVILPNARLVYGEDAMPLSTVGSPRLFFVVNDALGSPSLVIDEKTSELVEARTHDPFGATESDFRPARWQKYRERLHFTGKEEDSEVGLNYFGARYYSANLNRFISADPLPLLDGRSDLNLYAYVAGHVYTAIDPTGLQRSGYREDGIWEQVAHPPGWREHHSRWMDKLDQVVSRASDSIQRWDRAFASVLSEKRPLPNIGPLSTTGYVRIDRFTEYSGRTLLTHALSAGSPIAALGGALVAQAVLPIAINSDPDDKSGTLSIIADAVAGLVVGGITSAEQSAARVAVEGVTRALVAADVGLASNTALKTLQGTVTNIGTTRIINVSYIEAAGGTSLLPQLRSALPNIINAARADGITTLQIEASFANPGLERFATSATKALGGTYSSTGGRDFMTFILSGGR